MSILGDNTAGAGSIGGAADRALVTLFTAPDTGADGTMYARFNAASTAGSSVKGLIFANNSGTPGTLLASTAAVAVPAGGGLVTLGTVTISLTASTTYFVGLVWNSYESNLVMDDSLTGMDTEMMNGTYVSYTTPGNWGTTDISYSTNRVNVWLDYTAGGTVITRSLSESVTVVDSSGPVKARVRQITDTVNVADSSASVRSRSRLLQEYVTVVESVITGRLRGIVLSDAIVISDALSRALGVTRSLSDPITATDAIYRSIQLSRLLTDSISVLDSLSSSVVSGVGVISRILSDYLTTSDSINKFTRINRVFSEVVAVQDLVSRFIELRRQLTDAAIVSDTLTNNSVQMFRMLSDVADTLDSIAATKNIARELEDYVEVYDQLSISIARLVSTIIRNAIVGLREQTTVSGISNSRTHSGISDKDEETGL